MRVIETTKLVRSGVLERAEAETEGDRTVALSFSSEEPVDRMFGREILDHEAASVRLDRFRSGRAPLLLDHDTRQQIGVIESATIGSDRRGRAVVRFSKSARAEEVLTDIRDGIRSSISIGYRIHRLRLEEEGEEGDTYRAVDWEPLEISVVAVPADPSVGIGRSDDEVFPTQIEESRAMDDTKKPAVPTVEETAAVRDQAVKEAREAETSRVRKLHELGQYYRQPEIAQKAIDEGWSYERTNEEMRKATPAKPTPAAPPGAAIGLSDREVRNYSFVRAIRALANPADAAARAAAAFEFECSAEAAKRTGLDPKGVLVPFDVLAKRDLEATTTGAGEELVQTTVVAGSFIELLRKRLAVVGAGAQMLTGLTGNLAIPKQTAAATAYWITPEGGAPTESQQTLAQVPLAPKTVGAYTDYTRQLLLQSSIDVEAFVRNDLAQVLALAIDLAALYGSNASGQPRGLVNQVGINTPTLSATPTWAEVVGLESAVAADNADIGAMSYLMSATMRGVLKTTPKVSGQPIFIMNDDGSVNGYPARVSNQVVADEIFFGVWSQLLIGMWGGLDLMVDPYSLSTSGGVRVVALQSIDIAVRHPEAFAHGNPA